MATKEVRTDSEIVMVLGYEEKAGGEHAFTIRLFTWWDFFNREEIGANEKYSTIKIDGKASTPLTKERVAEEFPHSFESKQYKHIMTYVEGAVWA